MGEIYTNSGSVFKVGTVAGNITTSSYCAPPHSEPDSIYFNVRSPEKYFVGRSSELRNLENFMQTTSDSSDTQPQITVISGLGGIGKTQFVRRFINENRSVYENVIWINAEKAELIRESFKTLADNWLNILTIHSDGRPKDINSIIEQVFAKLSKRKTLFVYDNVDNFENLSFLLTIETSGEKPNVVITSRIKEWSDEITVIHLKQWELDEAIQYVSIALNNPKDSDDDKKLLVETLQFFPLALRQATAHINYRRKVEIFQITDYVSKFEFDTQEMLNSTFFKMAAFNPYEKTTFTTWKIAIDAIKRNPAHGQLAVRILNIIAYFDPENIHRDIFNHLRHELEEMTADIKSAVRLLVNYSMVDSQDEIQTVFSVHRLVQKVVQLNLQETNQENPVLQDVLQLISELIQKEQEIVNVSLPHAMSAFLSTLKITELIEKFSILPSKILSTAIKHIKYNQAKAFSDKIQEPLVTILGEHHEDMIETHSYIGKLYICQGLHTEALEINNDVYDKQMKVLGEYHQDTLTTRSDIGSSYRKLGRHYDALQIFEDVYEKQMNILGEYHPDTLTTRSHIGFSYIQLGKHTDALLIFEDVYEKQMNILGEYHLDTLTTKSYIGDSYVGLGKHDQAVEILYDIFYKKEFVLGQYHPDTLTTRSNIAFSYGRLGDHDEALQMYEDIYCKQKQILGEDHPNTLTTRSYIAYSYVMLGEHSKALQMYLDVNKKQITFLGENHPDTLTTRSYIAFCHRKLGEHSGALQIYENVYDRQKNILGEAHPDTLATRLYIANAYVKLGKASEAFQIYEDVYNRQKTILGENHPDTLKTRSDMGMSYRQLGKHREALHIFLNIYEIQKNFLGEDHPDILDTRSRIAFSHTQLGEHFQARQIYVEIYAKQMISLGKYHPDTLTTETNMMHSHNILGAEAEAYVIYDDFCDEEEGILELEEYDQGPFTRLHAFMRNRRSV